MSRSNAYYFDIRIRPFEVADGLQGGILRHVPLNGCLNLYETVVLGLGGYLTVWHNSCSAFSDCLA
jgi:hypothetical protein